MHEPEQTIDPKLRDAIKRCRSAHSCNQTVRSRIGQTLTAPPIRPSAAPRRIGWITRLAIAACLLLAGGVIEHYRHKAEEQRNYAAANTSLLEAMASAHTQPAADAQPVADVTDPLRVQSELSKRLSRSTPVPDLRPLGWSLAGASVTQLKGAIAARYDFTDQQTRATLFSLPQFAFVGAKVGQTYDIVV